MLGAIAGDIIGSVFEAVNVKSKDFPLFSPQSSFTDDTVLTVAVADSLLSGRVLVDNLRDFCLEFDDVGYGPSFTRWAVAGGREPYGSWGNGAAMRVSPVAYAFGTLEAVVGNAGRSAAITHDHPDGIRGAQAVAASVFLARKGAGKAAIAQAVTHQFGYDLSQPLDAIRPRYGFDVSASGSVPQAITAFLESTDFEDAVRNAVSLGGDSDTIACIAGAIAEAYYGGVPPTITREVHARLHPRLAVVVTRFYEQFVPRRR